MSAPAEVPSALMMGGEAVTLGVRRVTADDWRALRALRLEALADTPIGFLETLAEGRLVERCADWAREQGMPALRLEVHENHARARTAYARLGFTETGERQPYPLDLAADELVMQRIL